MNSHAVDLFASKLNVAVPRTLLEWLLAVEEIGRVIAAGRDGSPEHFYDGALQALDVECTMSAADRKRIPAKGPALLVANHPFGMLEGLILGSLLREIRQDYRFVANSLLADIPEISGRVLSVDPFGNSSSIHENGHSLRKAYKFLKEGGLLITFPAGEVSNLQGMPPSIVDSCWNSRLLRLARRAGAPVVPAFFSGRNSLKFQFAGLLHPSLRTALLCRELVNKRGSRFTLAVGTPIQPDRQEDFPTDRELTDYVRERTYVLGHRGLSKKVALPWPKKQQSAIADAQPAAALEADIAALPNDALLFAKGDYAAYFANAPHMPHLLPEIGRLREISFRAVGEGTGMPADLDRFDRYYHHLFLWKKSSREVVGAYRVAEVDKILERMGPTGLYTHTLFRFDAGFLDKIRDGLELGRSFIRVEHQRSVHPLHYLWKAIGCYLARSPRRYLFGPVSISEDYSEAARELIVAYFDERRGEKQVHPRCAFRKRNLPHLQTLAQQARGLPDLCDLVGDLETDAKAIPVLLRHYLNLGGEVLGFNVDREFSNALDGLLLVDLEKGNSVVDRYIGRAAAASA